MPEPEISVIVPTHDRPDSLARCLAALEAQTARDSLEVVVVDDGSTSETVKHAVRQSKGRRHLRAPSRGAAASRNAGAGAARGSLLLFTDDDCVPRPDWAAALAAPLREDAVAAAGTTLSPSRNQLGAASQHIADYLMTGSSQTPRRLRFAPSSNLGCRAEVLGALPFDESYPASGGEDRDWCARLTERGHELTFVPEATVAHHQQLTIGGFWRKHAGYGRGARIFRGHGVHGAGAFPGFHLKLLGHAFRRGPAIGGLVCLAQVATASGFARQALAERS